MKEKIGLDDFQKVDIRTGTVVEAELNPEARVPAYVMRIDFGELGLRTSSAQLTENYKAEDLVGKQIVAVVNFPPKQIAGIKSEVLVLGALSDSKGVVLLQPGLPVEDGMRVA